MSFSNNICSLHVLHHILVVLQNVKLFIIIAFAGDLQSVMFDVAIIIVLRETA